MAKKKVQKVEREYREQPYGYKVNIEQYCDHSEREDVEYGSWEESWINSMGDMIVREDKYPDVATIYDLKPGERAFVVWAEWSTGDSFGYGDRTNAEAIGLFVNYDDAEFLQRALGGRSDYFDKVSYYIKTPDGQIFYSGFAPWCGYFERLDSVRIDRVEVR